MTHSHRLAPLINLDQHEFYSSLDNAGWRRCHRLDDNRSISQIRKSVKEVPPGQDLRLANFTCFKEWYHGFGNPRIEVFSWEIPTKGLSIATFTERSPSQIYNAWIFGAQSLGMTCGYWQFSGSTRRFQGVQSQEAVSQWEEARTGPWAKLVLPSADLGVLNPKSCRATSNLQCYLGRTLLKSHLCQRKVVLFTSKSRGFRPFPGERKSRRASTTRRGREEGVGVKPSKVMVSPSE